MNSILKTTAACGVALIVSACGSNPSFDSRDFYSQTTQPVQAQVEIEQPTETVQVGTYQDEEGRAQAWVEQALSAAEQGDFYSYLDYMEPAAYEYKGINNDWFIRTRTALAIGYLETCNPKAFQAVAQELANKVTSYQRLPQLTEFVLMLYQHSDTATEAVDFRKTDYQIERALEQIFVERGTGQ
jgi:hypothetical protein